MGVIDLTRALKYPFSGPNVVAKTLIGSVFALLMPAFLPVLILLGYQQRIIRDVIDGRDDSLPEWDDLSGNLASGLMVMFGTLLYYLPAFILVGLGVKLALSALQPLDTTRWILGQVSLEFDRTHVGLMLICFALALIWLLLSAPLIMAATARYAETGEFSSFTHLLDRADEVWAQRRAAGSLMLNLFLLTLLTQVLSAIGSSTICLISVYIQFINFAAASHLNGQWGAVLKQSRPRPSVIRPIKPLTR